MSLIVLAALVAFAETPEKTVREFVAAFNRHDGLGMVKQVSGGSTPPPLYGMDRKTLRVEIQSTEVNGSSATVLAKVWRPVGMPGDPIVQETIRLRKVGGNWKITTVSPELAPSSNVVGFYAYLVSHPQVMEEAHLAARRVECIKNVKKLALGVLMFSADHNDRYPRADSWTSSIKPYIEDESLFHCIDDSSGKTSYFFEARLSGKAWESVKRPREMAMIVEGTAGKAVFRHQGFAMMAFADGSVRGLRAAEMAKARAIR